MSLSAALLQNCCKREFYVAIESIFEIISARSRVVIKPFYARIFQRSHYGESIIDFAKSTFFDCEVIFHSVMEIPRPFLRQIC